MNKTIILLSIVVIILFIYIYYQLNYVEHFVPGKACTNELATNFIDPVKLGQNTVSDDCTCDFPSNKVLCSRYFATNYQDAKYPDQYKRCHDKNAYNFELNNKIPDNTLCTYENNEICIFPTNLTNINSLFDIIDNPDEYISLLNSDNMVNYANIVRAGPHIPKNKHRGEKLELYYRLFNRKAISLTMSSYDPIYNTWDLSGKITLDQFKENYNKVVRTFDFNEDGLNTIIEVKGYGLSFDDDNNISYTTLVDKLTNNFFSDRNKHVALAVSLDCTKYGIGVGNTKDAAMDIAIANTILTNYNIDSNNKLEVNRSYTRTIYLFKKAQLMSLDEYDRIKKDIADKKIVSDESKLLIEYRDKLIENINNPVGILMIDNERYFKYPNNSEVLNKCNDLVKNIESKCFDNTIINGERNCNEVIVLRHDNNNDKCSIVQQNKNVFVNSQYDLSGQSSNKELTVNIPIKITNALFSDSGCGKNNVDCFIYSINDNRFCKG